MSWRKRLTLLGAGVVLSILGFAGVCLYLYYATDPLWQARQNYLLSHGKDQRVALAKFLHFRVVGASNPFKDQPNRHDAPRRSLAGVQHFDASLEEINAYMEIRLPRLLEKYFNLSLPKGVEGQMLAVNEQNQLEIKFRYRAGPMDRVITLVFELAIGGDGQGVLRFVGTRAGRLPIPQSLLWSSAKQYLGQEKTMGAFLEELAKGQMFFKPVMAVGPDQARVTKITLKHDRILVDYHFETAD